MTFKIYGFLYYGSEVGYGIRLSLPGDDGYSWGCSSVEIIRNNLSRAPGVHATSSSIPPPSKPRGQGRDIRNQFAAVQKVIDAGVDPAAAVDAGVDLAARLEGKRHLAEMERRERTSGRGGTALVRVEADDRTIPTFRLAGGSWAP